MTQSNKGIRFLGCRAEGASMKVKVWAPARVVEIDDEEIGNSVDTDWTEARLAIALETRLVQDLRMEYTVLEEKP